MRACPHCDLPIRRVDDTIRMERRYYHGEGEAMLVIPDHQAIAAKEGPGEYYRARLTQWLHNLHAYWHERDSPH